MNQFFKLIMFKRKYFNEKIKIYLTFLLFPYERIMIKKVKKKQRKKEHFILPPIRMHWQTCSYCTEHDRAYIASTSSALLTVENTLMTTRIPMMNGTDPAISDLPESRKENVAKSSRKVMYTSQTNAWTSVTFVPGSMTPKFSWCISTGDTTLMTYMPAMAPRTWKHT